MIIRLKGPLSSPLDFGSDAAIHQLLDNFPPHIREKFSFTQITLQELDQTREKLVNDYGRINAMSHQRPSLDGEVRQTPHMEWLLNRIEFYDKARPAIETYERNIQAQVNSLPTWDGRSQVAVNEVWRPD